MFEVPHSDHDDGTDGGRGEGELGRDCYLMLNAFANTLKKIISDMTLRLRLTYYIFRISTHLIVA